MDTEDNYTNESDHVNYTGQYGRKHFPLMQLYLAVPFRLIMSLAIVISASIVLVAIKKSRRNMITLHFFFIANLMIADIGVAVIRNGMVIINLMITIVNPTRNGMDCRILAVSFFPHATNAMMLAALCFDQLYAIAAPNHYRRNMTKWKGYAIVLTNWLVPFLLSFLSFFDPHLSSTQTKGAMCNSTFYKYFGLARITLPLFLSLVFSVIQNIYLHCVLVKTTNRNNDTGETGETGAREAWRMSKETKKESIVLLILSGASLIIWILQLVTIATVTTHVEESLVKTIVRSSVLNFILQITILVHSLLYGCFLHSIRESLGFDICRCFRSLPK